MKGVRGKLFSKKVFPEKFYFLFTNQSVDDLGVGDAVVDHHFRVHGDGGEAGEGIDFVEDEFSFGGMEEVNAGQALAFQRLEDGFGVSWLCRFL